MNTPNLMSLKHIAEVLRLHPERVRAHSTRRADFPRPLRVGGALRFDHAEIIDWIAAQRQPPDGRSLKRQDGNRKR